MREMNDGTFVPYAEFIARRHRWLRIMAELRSRVSPHTIEGEVLHARTGEVPARDQQATPEVSTPVDGCGTQENEERHRDVLVRSMRLIRRSDA